VGERDLDFCLLPGMDQRHEIQIEENTLLNQITGCVKGSVNSSHHQAVDTLGANLLVAARAEEPIVEAIQWKNADEQPFYLGVQVKAFATPRYRSSFPFLSVASGTDGRPRQSAFLQHSSSISRVHS
jgi:hypothetical protein